MLQMVRELAIQNDVILFEIVEYNPMLDSRDGPNKSRPSVNRLGIVRDE